MKYNNQSTFNGHQITNVVDRPVLHKKGKQWITVGLSTLLLAGLGAFTTIGNGVHASTNTVKANINQNLANNAKSNQPVNNVKNNQQNTNTKNITNQANDLHQRILANQSAFQHQTATNKPTQSNSSSNLVSKGLSKVASVSNADKSSNYNTLNLGTPAQQKRAWNYVQHGVNGNDYDNSKVSDGNKPKEQVANEPNVKDNGITSGSDAGASYNYNPSTQNLEFTNGTLNTSQSSNQNVPWSEGYSDSLKSIVIDSDVQVSSDNNNLFSNAYSLDKVINNSKSPIKIADSPAFYKELGKRDASDNEPYTSHTAVDIASGGGTYTTNLNPMPDNVQYKDIYSSDGFTVPKSHYLFNQTGKINWTYVNPNGTQSNKPVTKNGKVLVAPVDKSSTSDSGILYKYNKQTSTLTFISGNATYNEFIPSQISPEHVVINSDVHAFINSLNADSKLQSIQFSNAYANNYLNKTFNSDGLGVQSPFTGFSDFYKQNPDGTTSSKQLKDYENISKNEYGFVNQIRISGVTGGIYTKNYNPAPVTARITLHNLLNNSDENIKIPTKKATLDANDLEPELNKNGFQTIGGEKYSVNPSDKNSTIDVAPNDGSRYNYTNDILSKFTPRPTQSDENAGTFTFLSGDNSSQNLASLYNLTSENWTDKNGNYTTNPNDATQLTQVAKDLYNATTIDTGKLINSVSVRTQGAYDGLIDGLPNVHELIIRNTYAPNDTKSGSITGATPFQNTSLHKVVFSDGVGSQLSDISNIFSGCTNIQEVTFPKEFGQNMKNVSNMFNAQSIDEAGVIPSYYRKDNSDEFTSSQALKTNGQEGGENSWLSTDFTEANGIASTGGTWVIVPNPKSNKISATLNFKDINNKNKTIASYQVNNQSDKGVEPYDSELQDALNNSNVKNKLKDYQLVNQNIGKEGQQKLAFTGDSRNGNEKMLLLTDPSNPYTVDVEKVNNNNPSPKPSTPSNQNETDEIRFELANGHEDEGQVAVRGNGTWKNSNIAQYVPNGFSLDNNQQFTFGKYTKSDGIDNTDPYDSKRYHVIYVNPNDSNVPIKQNSVDINGNIVLHFGNSDVRVPLSFSAQNYPSGNVINLLKNTAYGDELNTPSDVSKLSNIDGSTVNPKLFSYDSSNKSNDSVSYKPNQSDVKYVHGSTGYIYKNINLYFKANGTNENINYITPNNENKGKATINGNANDKKSTNSLPNVPNGYSIASNNPSDVVINGGSSNINIIPNKHNINIKFNDGGKQLPNSDKTSGNTGSDIKPSSDKVPNGYHLVPGQHYTVPSDNNQSDNTTFNVKPNEEDKVVDYYYNQNGKNIFAGETHLQGNYDTQPEDIKSSNTPGLDTGYQLVNPNNNIDYKDGKTEEIVPVEPIKQDAKYQFVTPEGNGSKVKTLTNVSDKGQSNPSDNGISVNSLKVPANYHLVNTNQRIHYDGQISDIVVAPNEVNETIQFKDGKNIIIKGKNGQPTKLSGLYGSNGIYANQNIPSDYHIANDGSENFNFNNGTATVNVTRNSPDSVVGVATVTTNYEIAGHPNETKSVKHLVPISGSINDTPVTLYASNWSKNGFNNSNDKNNSWTINFDQNDVNNNGGNLRYHVDHTFNYIAKPIDVRVQFTDTTKDATTSKPVNKNIKVSDLGTIGIPGQYMDIQDDGDGKVDALTGDGLIDGNNDTPFRLPEGYHLANANNIMTVEPSKDSQGNAQYTKQGYPIMMLALNLGATNSAKPATPNKPASSSANNNNNKPASDNGGSVAPTNIPNVPNTPNIPSQPSDNINPVHFSDNNNPIIPNDNININIPSSSANNGSKASSASASNNNVAPASNRNDSDNFFIPNSDVKPAHHNIKRVNNVNDIKIGQTANYHGLKITNITNKIHYFYVYNIKGIQLHHNLFKVGRVQKDAVSVSAKRGFTGRILRYLRVNGKLRYEVRHNHKNYFITANPKFVRNAYYQPREFKRATHGLLPHVRIQLRKTAQLYKSVHYSKRTHVGTLHKGKKATVVGIRKIGRKGYQQTRLVLSNGLIITANKNYVKFI